MHPGMRALNDPSNLPKAAAVWLSASGNAGGNASLVQDAPVLVVIVASIRIDAFGPAQWPTANAFDRRDRLDQGDQLRDVIAVGAGQDCRDRCAVGVGGEVVLGTGSRSIGGVRASFSPAQPHESTRSRRPHVRSRSGLPRVVWSAATRAMHPTRQPLASPAAAASNSRPSHIPFLQEDRASECRSSARTECLSALRDSARACDPGT
ncbi:hypothetical protein BTM_1852 [Burkholderia thailandensis 34]|nr:hypothetical protein BTM_1852 [Burkholderia thailandensis 34]